VFRLDDTAIVIEDRLNPGL